ncbi:MAG: homoserine dehydrogenase [Micavibrio sp.]|nr:MAG: homoserine dehydrogenase [Micavibrio sp.]
MKPFRIAIAGLGTVGAGVVEILQSNADLIQSRTSRKIEIAAICDRDQDSDRGVDLSCYEWAGDAHGLADIGGLDAIVELIGGSQGIAYDLAKAALGKGVSIVTANKALLAHHGFELASLAETNGARIGYEAAVAGGIPIIKALREGLAGNDINCIYGILNGTCNYILTAMRETGADFEDVLKEAQEKGYAEADPTFDVDGIDAAHKLCLLTSLAFGVQPDFKAIETKGIRDITGADIRAAQKFGYKIKLLGIAKRQDGKISQSVEPCLVPADSSLGGVEDSYNAVFVEGDFVEKVLMTGRGAGRKPTASAVVADIIDLAKGLDVPVFGVKTDKLAKPVWADAGQIKSCYYIRAAGDAQITEEMEQVGLGALTDKLDSPYIMRVEDL